MKYIGITTIALTAIGVAVRANVQTNKIQKLLDGRFGPDTIDFIHERIDVLEKQL